MSFLALPCSRGVSGALAYLLQGGGINASKDNAIPISASAWPSCAEVSFQDVTLVYRPGLPPAIRGVSVTFKGREHTGVIGRTGAGKSSLFVVLFRLCEAAGVVRIDGIDISKVGLITLRRTMAIIPQSPLLLQGTVRHNIDPFGDFEEAQIASVLRRVGLFGGSTSTEVDSNDAKPGHGHDSTATGSDHELLMQVLGRQVAAGVGLSAGEQQLLSFARALLRIEHGQVKLVIMDEPTAHIDMATDERLQALVRSTLADHTVITIAHRLNTVIDFDKILVMDSGRCVEFGAPTHLLADPESHLAQAVGAMGDDAAGKLVAKAMAADSTRRKAKKAA